MNCPFCNRESMLTSIPIDNKIYPCCRWIYKNNYCYAVLKPEQHTIGDTIVVLNEHKEGITSDIHGVLLYEFSKVINKVSNKLLRISSDYSKEKPVKIYVGILGDGIQHLHAHLIPRYPFTDYDREKYRRLFIDRDGEEEINCKIANDDLGGYWYISDKEEAIHKAPFSKQSPEKKVMFIESLAKYLRDLS